MKEKERKNSSGQGRTGWKNEEKETRFQMGKFARGINYPFPLLFNKAERNSATRRAKVVSLSKNISSSLAFFNTEGSVSEITAMRKQSSAVFQPYIPAKPHSRTWREKRRQGEGNERDVYQFDSSLKLLGGVESAEPVDEVVMLIVGEVGDETEEPLDH